MGHRVEAAFFPLTSLWGEAWGRQKVKGAQGAHMGLIHEV